MALGTRPRADWWTVAEHPVLKAEFDTDLAGQETVALALFLQRVLELPAAEMGRTSWSGRLAWITAAFVGYRVTSPSTA